jgi:hypothetical protein
VDFFAIKKPKQLFGYFGLSVDGSRNRLFRVSLVFNFLNVLTNALCKVFQIEHGFAHTCTGSLIILLIEFGKIRFDAIYQLLDFTESVHNGFLFDLVSAQNNGLNCIQSSLEVHIIVYDL